MNAQELFHKDGRGTGRGFCGQCRIIHLDMASAEECCQNYQCRTCGKDTGGRLYSLCGPCQSIERAGKEQERFEKAAKLTEWDGWLYCEGFGYHGEGDYSESIGDLIDWCDQENEGVRPKYAWACNPVHFAIADTDDLLERIRDRAYEDFDMGSLDGMEELQAAIAKFNEANSGLVSWEPDFTKAVLIPQADVPAEHAE